MRVRRSWLGGVAAAAAALSLLAAEAPAPAQASPLKSVCAVAGFVSGAIGRVCTVATHGGRLIQGARKLAGGHVGAGFKAILGTGAGKLTGASMAALALAALDHSVVQAAVAALAGTRRLLMRSVSPRLDEPWFSATYWRMAAVASLLTLPFLFACAVQAVLRSDLALLLQAGLGYLPLAGLAIALAAPLTMLLLAATDQLCRLVARGAGANATYLLSMSSAASLVTGTPFLMVLLGLLAASAAVVVWVELLIRQAAVLIVVLMLPLVFAALAWPARRIWAIRLVELLVALILAKFVIVAILTLGGSALGAGGPSAGRLLAGATLMLLGAGSPWAILRILPHTQAAGTAMGELRSATGSALATAYEAGAPAGPLARPRPPLAEGQEDSAHAEAAAMGHLAEPFPEATSSPEDDEAPGRSGAVVSGAGTRTNAIAPEYSAGSDEDPAQAPVGGRSPAEVGLALAREAATRRGALTGDEGATPTRMPGWEEMWQAENMSWDPVVLDDTSPILPLFTDEPDTDPPPDADPPAAAA